jgi:hypothetical protein
VAIELLLVLPYLALLSLATFGLACVRLTPPAVLLLVLAAAYNAAHVAAYATTRFRLPVLPVLFMLAAALLVGRGGGTLAALRGRRLALLVVLAIGAAVVLAPGMEELVTWQRLTGRS